MYRRSLTASALFLFLAGWWLSAAESDDLAPLREAVTSSESPPAAFAGPPTAVAELRVLDGFEANVYAGDDIVHNAYCLTVDRSGRVAVSGPGYIRLLVDQNLDGRADGALPFADGPASGAQGLCFDGTDLLAVGDGGLLRYSDDNNDGRSDGPPSLLLKLKTGGEHHAHAIRRGPDGWWYLMCGNDTGITAADVSSPNSPVRDPEAGVLLRFHYEASMDEVNDVQVFADGLRNAYDFDFTLSGDAVTYDSDDEREVSLPWYRPTRVFRLTPGAHAGWLSRSWKRPDAYPEMPEVLASLGRGSPTGVAVAHHDAFPPPFHRAVFVCDWTFGRVIAIPLREDGSPGAPIDFLAAAGDAGFAPSDLEFGPDGSLFISAGGRGTTGTVYRVRHTGKGQPSRGAEPSRLLDDPRSALESLAGSDPARPLALDSIELLTRGLADADPNVRKAAMHVVSRLNEPALAKLAARTVTAGDAAHVRFHVGRLRRNARFDLAGLECAVAALEAGSQPPELRYDAVRLAQLSLGDLGPAPGTPDSFAGYAPRADLAEWEFHLEPLAVRLAALFPTGESAIDEELVRLLAMLASDDATVLGRVLDRITPDSHPTDDLHHLFGAARLTASRTAEHRERIAGALLFLDVKLATRGLRLDSNWDERLGDLVAALSASDRGLIGAIASHSEFGRAAHAVLLKNAPDGIATVAARALIEAADSAPDDFWSPEAVALLGRSAEPAARECLRLLSEDPAFEADALAALAEHPEAIDRHRFVAGLDDSRIEVVDRAVRALERLGASDDVVEVAALVRALRRLDRDEREYGVRNRVANLLRRAVGEEFGFVFGKEGHRPQADAVARWVDYARGLAPELLAEPAGDWEALRPLADAAAALTGDAMRGRTSYEVRSCARCHDGGSVGPDLAGVAGRFSREDLFRAIVDPDRDVPERYRGCYVQTTDGRVLTGLVVYESADGVTLMDGTKTWRVEADEIELRQAMATSVMPRGLLKEATAQELADIEAYLRTRAK